MNAYQLHHIHLVILVSKNISACCWEDKPGGNQTMPPRPPIPYFQCTDWAIPPPSDVRKEQVTIKKPVIFLFVPNGAVCEVNHSKMIEAMPPLSHMPSQHAQGQLYLDLHNISEMLSSFQKNLSTRIRHTSKFRVINFIRCYPVIRVKCKTGYNMANRSRRPANCCIKWRMIPFCCNRLLFKCRSSVGIGQNDRQTDRQTSSVHQNAWLPSNILHGRYCTYVVLRTGHHS